MVPSPKPKNNCWVSMYSSARRLQTPLKQRTAWQYHDARLDLQVHWKFGPSTTSNREKEVTDLGWIDAALTSARPQALAALLRYFRDLDIAEEAYQEACLRALQRWPVNGPPRDPAAWLILVGRNFAVDETRRKKRTAALPDDELISDLGDTETELAERLDSSQYRDDILRLLFICCHPDLPATQQIALALRLVSGLSVKEIARAFLVSESAMEQRITRAKSCVAKAGVPFETPGAIERF